MVVIYLVVFGVKIICNRQSSKSKICTSGDAMDFLCTRCDQKRLFVLPLVLNFDSGSLDQFFLLYVATVRVPINSIIPNLSLNLFITTSPVDSLPDSLSLGRRPAACGHGQKSKSIRWLEGRGPLSECGSWRERSGTAA